MRTPALLLCCAIVAAELASCRREEPAGGGSPAPTSRPSPGTTTSRSERIARENERLIAHVWWNNPKLVAALRLTEAQRAKMNELLVHRLENQRAIKSDYLEKRAAFEQALRKGNPQAAQAAAVELRKRVAEGSEGRFALVIDVVAVLEPAQRETLFSQYPATLRRPLWKRVHSFSPRERAEPQ